MAGSPPADTPTSTTTPTSLAATPTTSTRPSICMKPVLSTTQVPPITGPVSASLTSREWIIPPRPKPGRKPATDTPPTKRKAQNRAAQRAFRERRAARVGELEDQIKQTEQEHEQEHESLRSQVIRLEKEVERYRDELARWMDKCQQLEKERDAPKPYLPSVATEMRHSTEPRSDLTNEHTLGCGSCTADTTCQCIDDVVNAISQSTNDQAHVDLQARSGFSSETRGAKRIKREPSDDMEIDFTAIYSRPRNALAREAAVSPTSIADPCGFCQDGTPCICAEMAAEQERRNGTAMPSGRQLAQFTPPPSDGDVINPVPRQAGDCASGPGTCAQCQLDPNSTLFCKSLAASRAQAGMSGGCCGGKGADGNCCQASVTLPPRNMRSRVGKAQLPPIHASNSITLSCADAFTTLSRHPAYNRASSEIATWMPKLYANPVGTEGRPALEIDAANVMSVLRDFDRRFGSER